VNVRGCRERMAVPGDFVRIIFRLVRDEPPVSHLFEEEALLVKEHGDVEILVLSGGLTEP
jgi:hypothetical protein